jgi:O-antigen polysaccharide polymerase Wzy
MSNPTTPPGVGQSGRSAMLMLIGGSLLVAAVSILEIQSDFSSSDNWAPFVASVSALWLVAWVASTWVFFGTPYLFASAYVMAIAVFHLGLLIPYGFGIVDVLNWAGEGGRWIRVASWYTALAFGVFGAAFAVHCLRHKPRRPGMDVRDRAQLIDGNLAKLRNLSVGLALGACASLIIATLSLGNLLAYTRFDLFFRVSDPRFLSLFFFLAPTAAIGLVVTARTKPQRLGSYLFAAVMLLVALLSGNRSWALFPLLAGVIVWVKLGRRIPMTVAASVIAGVLIAIPIVATLRTLGTYEDISLKAIQASKQDAAVIDALFEMGSTLGTLAVTLEHIPEDEPYRLGRPYLIYLRQAIPNIGMTASREYARDTVYQKIMSDPKAVIEMDPADWTSWKVIPESFLSGAGTGYSAVAEPYYSFGPIGLVVWFVAVGLFLARMDLLDIRLHYRWLVFATFFFWSLPVTCRNSFGVFTKPGALILAVIGIWLLVRGLTPFGAPKAARKARATAR